MVLTATALIASITVLVLSIFLGFELITKVPPTLHTPLMSGANAISGVTIVGALMASNAALEGGSGTTAAILGCLALILATINCVGGFMVTGRMLEMFSSKKKRGA
jgi:NAD(P) transhydrogenase subunit alpha